MGKVLIDKLLRTCPGIENIYLLIRKKKGKDIHSRIEELFDDPVRTFLTLLSSDFIGNSFSCLRSFASQCRSSAIRS